MIVAVKLVIGYGVLVIVAVKSVIIAKVSSWFSITCGGRKYNNLIKVKIQQHLNYQNNFCCCILTFITLYETTIYGCICSTMVCETLTPMQLPWRRNSWYAQWPDDFLSGLRLSQTRKKFFPASVHWKAGLWCPLLKTAPLPFAQAIPVRCLGHADRRQGQVVVEAHPVVVAALAVFQPGVPFGVTVQGLYLETALVSSPLILFDTLFHWR